MAVEVLSSATVCGAVVCTRPTVTSAKEEPAAKSAFWFSVLDDRALCHHHGHAVLTGVEAFDAERAAAVGDGRAGGVDGDARDLHRCIGHRLSLPTHVAAHADAAVELK